MLLSYIFIQILHNTSCYHDAFFQVSVYFKSTVRVWLLPSQGDGQVEDRQHHGATVISEQVSYDGGRDGGVAGLTDAHQSPGEHKQPVVLQRDRDRERRRQRKMSFIIELCRETFCKSRMKTQTPLFLFRGNLIFLLYYFHLVKKQLNSSLLLALTISNNSMSVDVHSPKIYVSTIDLTRNLPVSDDVVRHKWEEMTFPSSHPLFLPHYMNTGECHTDLKQPVNAKRFLQMSTKLVKVILIYSTKNNNSSCKCEIAARQHGGA